MIRILAVLLLLPVLAACPDRRATQQDTIPVDTASDLSTIVTDIPEPVRDTSPPPKARQPQPPPARAIPPASGPLLTAVQREQGFTQFCYREFGLKREPGLRGGVTLIVTVGAEGVSGARVGASRWQPAGAAGREVDRCLAERAPQALRLTPGEVRPGQYQVQYTFSGA